MAGSGAYDAVVVGAGPNGLAAAVELARNGRSVAVLEAEETPGGGTRSAEITLPGFVHDLGSAIHPLGYASPFFSELPLEEYGLEWVHPPAPLAHPFDDGTAAVLERSVQETAGSLGSDAPAYRRLIESVAEDAPRIASYFVGSPRLIRHPIALGASALRALRPARSLAESAFEGEKARGLFAGNAAHSFLPLEKSPSALFGLLLGTLGHAFGWPFPKGGSQRIADALTSYLLDLGGEVYTGFRVDSVEEVPRTRAVLLDVTPRQLLDIAGEHFTERYRHALKDYRYGPGVFKVDFALDGPIPWKAEECLRAGTVHLGGTLDEISAGEAAVWRGEHPERPFVLLAQQSLFDQITGRGLKNTFRFAPGFGERVLAKTASGPADFERQNANLVGGDINGGVPELRQLFTRPVLKPNPYSTPAQGIFVCSSSTPPGGGVHGMCGYFAARVALRYLS